MNRCPPPPARLKVVDLNPHLSCILCGGYFIDATTITECLHSFCRACIVRYLETSEYCPVCEVQVHKSRPLRSDKILQDIVYKLVPGLFHNEMKRRRELYASQPPEAIKESRDAEDRGECLDEKFIYAPDEIFSLSVEYGKEVEKDPASEEDNVPRRRFLRCPAAVTVSHLKKFVTMKYGIPNSYEIDLKYDKESLPDDYTLIDIAYIFLWRRRGPMRFFYKIVERPPKKSPATRQVYADDCSAVETARQQQQQSAEAEVAPTTPTKETKDRTGSTENTSARSTPVQPVQLPQSSDKDVAPSSVADPTPTPLQQTPPPSEVVVTTTSGDSSSVPSGDNRIDAKKEKQQPLPSKVDEPTCKKESTPKSIPFRFPPISQLNIPNKSTGCCSSTSETGGSVSKPAVMTVAPLTTGTTTSSPSSVTHGHGTVYTTGISIKKSSSSSSSGSTSTPPLPPFKISTHLLSTPKVPPLKLSPPRFSKLETCLRELSSSSKKSSASRKSKSSKSSSCGDSTNKLELKVAQLKSSASSKCVAPLVITVPPEAKIVDPRKDQAPVPSTSGVNVCSGSSAPSALTVTIPALPPKPTEDTTTNNKRKTVCPPTTTSSSPVSKGSSVETTKTGKVETITTTATTTTATTTTTDATSKQQQPLSVPTAPTPESSSSSSKVTSSRLDDKMDLDEEDSDLFEGPLVIAEPPDIPANKDGNDSDTNSRHNAAEDQTAGQTSAATTTTTTTQPLTIATVVTQQSSVAKELLLRQSSSSKPTRPQEDSEDEEIDVVDDVDSGRGSDVSSGRTEARSVCGFDLDDLGSPDSVPPKTPEAAEHNRHAPLPSPIQVPSPTNHQHPFLPEMAKSSPAKTNGVAKGNASSTGSSNNGGGGNNNKPQPPQSLSNGGGGGSDMVLDLSTCSRKRGHDNDDDDEYDRQRHRHHRAKQVANPAVLDKTRQTSTPCVSPRNHVAQPPPFKVLATADLPPASHHLGALYKGGKSGAHESGRSSSGNFKCRGNTLTVINADPNGGRPKIVIRNLGPRPGTAADRFHHHHHHHHHHGNSGGSNHQRM